MAGGRLLEALLAQRVHLLGVLDCSALLYLCPLCQDDPLGLPPVVLSVVEHLQIVDRVGVLVLDGRILADPAAVTRVTGVFLFGGYGLLDARPLAVQEVARAEVTLVLLELILLCGVDAYILQGLTNPRV